MRLKLGRGPISHGNLALEASSAILRCVVGPAQIRRVEKLPLQLATDLMHGTRANDIALGERMRDRVQKWIAQVDRQRAGRRPSRHQAQNRRGGWAAWETASLACALRGAAQGCAVLRFVSFVLAPMRLAPRALFSDRRLRRPRSVKLADGPAPARSLRCLLLDERARNVRPLVVRVHCW